MKLHVELSRTSGRSGTACIGAAVAAPAASTLWLLPEVSGVWLRSLDEAAISAPAPAAAIFTSQPETRAAAAVAPVVPASALAFAPATPLTADKDGGQEDEKDEEDIEGEGKEERLEVERLDGLERVLVKEVA